MHYFSRLSDFSGKTTMINLPTMLMLTGVCCRTVIVLRGTTPVLRDSCTR